MTPSMRLYVCNILSQQKLFLLEINNRETIAPIEANNYMYCLKKRIEKLPLYFGRYRFDKLSEKTMQLQLSYSPSNALTLYPLLTLQKKKKTAMQYSVIHRYRLDGFLRKFHHFKTLLSYVLSWLKFPILLDG